MRLFFFFLGVAGFNEEFGNDMARQPQLREPQLRGPQLRGPRLRGPQPEGFSLGVYDEWIFKPALLFAWTGFGSRETGFMLVWICKLSG